MDSNGTGIAVRYTGFAPIATCHWQSLANILAEQGLENADRSLCVSWGFRDEGTVLFGGGRWPDMLKRLHGIEVRDLSFADDAEGDAFELAFAKEGRAFVAEIDAFYVPSPYRGNEHVVHTVIVVDRTDQGATILDTTNNPVPVRIGLPEYRTLRGSPCAGRLDPRRLYAAWGTPDRRPRPIDVADAVRQDIRQHADKDLEHLKAFIQRFEASHERINVCRAAAERHGASRLFALLAERGVAGAAEVRDRLRGLADEWYLVHMLSEHSRADEQRQRHRLSRKLRGLLAAEAQVYDEIRRR